MLGIKLKTATYKKDGQFLTYARHCDQKVTIDIVKLTLKIPPRHIGVIPINITGQTLKKQMVFFITDDDSTKGKDPNINIVNGLHDIK